MLLTVDRLSVFYGPVQALREISFTVAKGEIVSLIGANGAGKSTTRPTGSRAWGSPMSRRAAASSPT